MTIYIYIYIEERSRHLGLENTEEKFVAEICCPWEIREMRTESLRKRQKKKERRGGREKENERVSSLVPACVCILISETFDGFHDGTATIPHYFSTVFLGEIFLRNNGLRGV